ncbi:Superoxide dismutase [Mn]-like 3, partial [Homarus americanus]
VIHDGGEVLERAPPPGVLCCGPPSSAMFLLHRALITRRLAGVGVRCCQKHTLPDLPYDYNALEPVISADIMQLHHSKHHQTYVNNLNVAEEKLAEATAKGDVSTVISLAAALKFNGGGHINHTIFWKNLSPDGGEPEGELLAAINRDFGSLDALKSQLSAATVAVQGSGWGWLGYNKQKGALQIATCPNQLQGLRPDTELILYGARIPVVEETRFLGLMDPLEATTGLVPLFGIDVWEHAYYLQYKNVRPDYVNAIWKVADWKDISARFNSAK